MLTRSDRGTTWQASRQPWASLLAGTLPRSISLGSLKLPAPVRTRHLPQVPRPAQSTGTSTAPLVTTASSVSPSGISTVTPMGSTNTLVTCASFGGAGGRRPRGRRPPAPLFVGRYRPGGAASSRLVRQKTTSLALRLRDFVARLVPMIDFVVIAQACVASPRA